MTSEELKANGWKPKLCKLGTFFFKGRFFCRLLEDKAIVYSIKDDTNSLGSASTIEEIISIEKNYDIQKIKDITEALALNKLLYKNMYGEPYPE